MTTSADNASWRAAAPARRILEVERDRALVAIDRGEILAVAVDERRPGAHEIPVGRFDLDHVGAHVGEQAAAERTGEDLAEFDDFDAGEGKHCEFDIS